MFFAICSDAPNKHVTGKPKDKFNILSILLFVLSVCTMWGALLGVSVLSAINHAMTENMWVFFLFLPIPIASIAFGFYLKKKGYRYKLNVIVGIIMAALLCIFGSFSLVFADVYAHGDEPILKVEQAMCIDIPQHSHINTRNWENGMRFDSRGVVYAISDLYFDAATVDEFEKNLSNDSRWIVSIPNDMIGITSYFSDMQTSDYCLIYNVDTGEFNKLPDASGTYLFFNLLYDIEDHTMQLVEYQITYTK